MAADIAAPEPDQRGGAAHPEKVARDSLAVSAWTVLSRVTGVGKVVAIGAVLGPTYVGNVYQTTNLLPNLVYEFLTGSLFASLLVPPLVRLADAGDSRGIERLAGGFLGIATLGFALIASAAVLGGRAVMAVLFTGVEDPAVAAEQSRVGALLLTMFMPQVVLYGFAGTGAAVMNAHGRFVLAAAAPALENLGIMGTLVATAFLFGTGPSLMEVGTPQLLLLGLGTTGAVALHAGAVLVGVRRLGVRLLPRAGWRQPDVSRLIRTAVPSLGYAGLNALRVFATIVVANRIRGGVVAFQMARNFSALPVAIAARPIALALLPRLSRLHDVGQRASFRMELSRARNATLFLVIPAATAFVLLANPIARAFSFGEIGGAVGVTLVAFSLAAMGPGVLGESTFVLGTHASYARRDAASPFRSMVVRTLTSLTGMVIAFLADGPMILVVLGLALSAGDLLGAWDLNRRVAKSLPDTNDRLLGSAIRALAGSVIMAVPAYAATVAGAGLIGGQLGELAGMVGGAVAGALTFLVVQKAWRAPELVWLTAGLGPGSRRSRS